MADQGGGRLWGGRFSEDTDKFVQRFTASVPFDRRLYRQDIEGSVAHARMLCDQGVLSDEEFQQIADGLQAIGKDIDAGVFDWRIELEDVHMNIEAALTEKIGVAGKKLHTGRSRNDQVATDLRMWLREEIDGCSAQMQRLQEALIALAEREAHTVMPGFTHLQVAQPISFGHHMLAWNEMLERDRDRIADCRRRVNVCPLGAAALAGTSYPIDREQTARELRFSAPARNSLDAVSDRDFAIEFCACAALLMTHLSRFCEELILWNSAQFSFVALPDRFCTGSSIMPQKKNPDVPELVRGKTGRVTGHLVALLTLMKAQPLAYNKDNQEDKEPLFDTVDTLNDCLHAFADMMPALEVNRDRMHEAAQSGFSTATDLADYLVRRGVAFRDAHKVVGKAVALSTNTQRSLESLSLTELRTFSEAVDEDVFDYLSVEGSLASRDHFGGSAPAQVLEAARLARARLSSKS